MSRPTEATPARGAEISRNHRQLMRPVVKLRKGRLELALAAIRRASSLVSSLAQWGLSASHTPSGPDSLGSNDRVCNYKTAAEPRLTALCNSRAPPEALGRQESVRRVVVRKSVARSHAAPWEPVPTRLDLHNRRAEP
jgi:hypothetical protein